jgi:hypothetical protein
MTVPPGSGPEPEIHSPDRSRDGVGAGTEVCGECAHAESKARREIRIESVTDIVTGTGDLAR